MSYLSDFQRQSATLRGNAGPVAIKQNDLLELALGQLYPVQTSDYAAFGVAFGTIVPPIIVSTGGQSLTTGKNSFVNPVDLSSFMCVSNSTNHGLTIYKYDVAGNNLGNLWLDATASVPCSVSIAQLSNNNLVIVWGLNNHALKFAIVDLNCNSVVATTSITAAAGFDGSNNSYCDVIGLSGGGFAVSYGMPSAVNLAIYTNAGGVTFAGAAIPLTPTTDGSTVCAAPRMAQLSSGNIAIAIASTTTFKALGHCISTVAGTPVLGYTVLNNATLPGTATCTFPEISTIAGTYCCVLADWMNATAYVLNNAGTIQGGAYSSTYNHTTSNAMIINDGTGYWGLYGSNAVYRAILAYIPVTGTGFVTNIVGSVSFPSCIAYDGFGFVMSNIGLYKLGAGGVGTSIGSYLGTPTVSATTAIMTGDFSVLTTTASPQQFQITKFLGSAIVGVAQTALAAGNAGTLINYSAGPSAYTINAIRGSVGKSFSHAQNTIAGNSGVLLGSSAVLRGVGVP